MSLLKEAIEQMDDDMIVEMDDKEKQDAAKRCFKVMNTLYDQVEALLDTIDDVQKKSTKRDMKALGFSEDMDDILEMVGDLEEPLSDLNADDLEAVLPGLEMMSKGEE